MPRVFHPNPNSLVHLAIANAGGIKALAGKVNLSEQSVAQWARIDRIPRRHLLNVALIADIPPLELIEYAERSTKPYFYTPAKPKQHALDTLLDVFNKDKTLEQAFLDTDIAPRTLKQTLTLWGDRLPLLHSTLRSDSPKAVKAARLGITERQLNRLIKTYLPPVQKPLHPRKEKRNEAQKKWNAYKNYVIKTVRGEFSVKAAAELAKISERQMHRHMLSYIESFGLGFNTIRTLPRSFRYALAHEIDNERISIVKPLIDYWRKHKMKPVRLETPATWAKTHYRRCLIGVLMGEITLKEVIEQKQSHKAAVIEQFDSHLHMLGTTWANVSTWSLHHQGAVADILANLG